MSLLNCCSEGVAYAFLDRYLVKLGFKLKFSFTKAQNFVGNSKSYVKKH
jgi:hypothetical protein